MTIDDQIEDEKLQYDINRQVAKTSTLSWGNAKKYEYHFLSTSGLALQACLKKTGVKLKLLKDNNMLMIVEKVITGGIYHAIHSYVKANNKYMKNCDKNIESWYLMY